MRLATTILLINVLHCLTNKKYFPIPFMSNFGFISLEDLNVSYNS